jgi:Contractile injection system tube protein
MGLGDLFGLAKLTIEGFKEESRQGVALGTFTAQYNPETFSLHHENVFQGQQGIGSTAGANPWSYSGPKRLSVSLVLNGTNVGYMGVELLRRIPTVAEQITSFLSTCYQLVGEIHQPLYLKLSWGKALGGFAALAGFGAMPAPSFHCRLESVDIAYQAFDRDGAPLHAVLAATFVEQLDPAKQAAVEKRSSPDLTHRRVVVDGDTLPLLCREIYGSPSHYLRVAEVNGLDDFRTLTAGQELLFPPFERAGSD